MWYRLMATVWTMYVRRVVTVANMTSGAGCRIRIVDIERVLLHNSSLSLMVQMTIMQKVNMIPVLDGCVSTVGSVDVIMVFVCMAHVLYPFFQNAYFGKNCTRSFVRLFAVGESVGNQMSDMAVG